MFGLSLNNKRNPHTCKRFVFVGVGGGHTEEEVCRLWAAIPGGCFLFSGSSPAAATDAHWGMNRAAVTANRSFSSSPWAHSSPHLVVLATSALNMEELICTFCRQHPFLFIFLLVSPLSPSFRQGCAVRLFQSAGVVTSDGWLSTFCCLPLRSWEIYRLADYQAWKPISLSHSSLPSSIHAALAPSILLPEFLHLLCYPKNFYNREMCAEQYWNLCVDTGK